MTAGDNNTLEEGPPHVDSVVIGHDNSRAVVSLTDGTAGAGVNARQKQARELLWMEIAQFLVFEPLPLSAPR
jgi:hypothetical protein